MNKHLPRRHATEQRDPLTGEKITVYKASCAPCNVWGKAFRSRAARDRFLDNEHPA